MKPWEYIIRSISRNEIDNVIRINRECLPENYSRFFFEEIFRNFQRYFLVAEFNGKIVGYAMARVETIFHLFKLQKKLHLISIAVLPSFRRMGIASSLLKKLEEEAVSADIFSIFLEVRVSNYGALSLYRKMGFKMVQVLKKYYRDGEDAYLMEKILSRGMGPPGFEPGFLG